MVGKGAKGMLVTALHCPLPQSTGEVVRSRGQEQGQLMDGWLMDGRSRPALKSEGRKIPQGRPLYSFSGNIASRTSETGQLPGRKPVAKHGPSLGSSLPHRDSPIAILIQ